MENRNDGVCELSGMTFRDASGRLFAYGRFLMIAAEYASPMKPGVENLVRFEENDLLDADIHEASVHG